LAVLEGRLEPLPEINYDEFLEEYLDKIATGLTTP
jgi:hypothetical protein